MKPERGMIGASWRPRWAAGARYGILTVLAAVLLATPGHAADPGALARCQSMPDGRERLKCYDEALSLPSPASPLPPGAATGRAEMIGPWRLVHTPHPQGGKEVVSIMRAADLADSAPEFAGLMLRCSEADLEVLVAVIPPLPPRAKPRLDLGSGPARFSGDGTVVPPGSAILLPAEAAGLARREWQTLQRLPVEIRTDDETIRGSVSLAGLGNALDRLTSACRVR